MVCSKNTDFKLTSVNWTSLILSGQFLEVTLPYFYFHQLILLPPPPNPFSQLSEVHSYVYSDLFNQKK